MTEYARLAAGNYGTSTVPGLEIIKYLEPKENKDGSIRHSFLVKALMPSREQTEMILAAKKNGMANNPYLEEPSFEGTQFLKLNLKQEWLTPAAIAVAMGREQVYLAKKKVDQTQLEAAQLYFVEQAGVNPLHTTEEQLKEAEESLKTQIQINVGTIFRLQKWAGKEENEAVDFESLVGTKFSGVVKTRTVGGRKFFDVNVKPQKGDKG